VKIGVVISEGPYTHQAADTAYHFVKSALAKGHEVPRVFFTMTG
jgi:tRNA 2-thiouridine synthesizing protein D